METTTARQQRPAIRYRDMVKGMNNDEKIELMFVLIESMRSSMSADSESEPPLMPPYSEEEKRCVIRQNIS